MLNLYINQDEIKETIENDYSYLYIGGVMAVSFLIGPYIAVGSGIGSAGYLYYKNYYKQSVKPPKPVIEMSSIYICKNV